MHLATLCANSGSIAPLASAAAATAPAAAAACVSANNTRTQRQEQAREREREKCREKAGQSELILHSHPLSLAVEAGGADAAAREEGTRRQTARDDARKTGGEGVHTAAASDVAETKDDALFLLLFHSQTRVPISLSLSGCVCVSGSLRRRLPRARDVADREQKEEDARRGLDPRSSSSSSRMNGSRNREEREEMR